MVVLLSLNFTWFTYRWNGGYEYYSGTERAFAAPWDGGLEMRRAGAFAPALTCIFLVAGSRPNVHLRALHERKVHTFVGFFVEFTNGQQKGRCFHTGPDLHLCLVAGARFELATFGL